MAKQILSERDKQRIRNQQQKIKKDRDNHVKTRKQ